MRKRYLRPSSSYRPNATNATETRPHSERNYQPTNRSTSLSHNSTAAMQVGAYRVYFWNTHYCCVCSNPNVLIGHSRRDCSVPVECFRIHTHYQPPLLCGIPGICYLVRRSTGVQVTFICVAVVCTFYIEISTFSVHKVLILQIMYDMYVCNTAAQQPFYVKKRKNKNKVSYICTNILRSLFVSWQEFPRSYSLAGSAN